MELAQVFISWSGEPSRLVASALRTWLPEVFQTLDPFMSEGDIPAGAVWFDTIGRRLESSDFAILCVTSANQNSPWLHFEAGAMAASHSTEGGSVPPSVMPLLLDIGPTDLRPPLSLYNGVEADRDGVRRLLDAVNRYLPAKLAPNSLDNTFDKWWPDLEEQLQAARIAAETSSEPRVERSDREMLEELLGLARTANNPPAQVPVFGVAGPRPRLTEDERNRNRVFRREAEDACGVPVVFGPSGVDGANMRVGVSKDLLTEEIVATILSLAERHGVPVSKVTAMDEATLRRRGYVK